jgi:pimeloyl-ACP methyl ester carboxylesterase
MLAAGCATPIGVRKVGISGNYHELDASALAGSGVSSESRLVLHRHRLDERYRTAPAEAIAALHETALHDPRPDLLFVLSELSFDQALRLQARRPAARRREALDYFLMAAFYASRFLRETAGSDERWIYDRRSWLACDLLNRALGGAFSEEKTGALVFREGPRALPVGRIEVALDSATLPWKLEEFDRLLPADQYEVRGLSVRNRTSGIGLPVVALHKETPEMSGGFPVPISVFPRMDGGLQELSSGTARLSLEFHSGLEDAEIAVGRRKVPVETDTTAPLAFALEGSEIWRLGKRDFLHPRKQGAGLIQVHPYQAGLIPVVFVHGTASSPAWWAEMWNTLRSDQALRSRCQFWFFTYSSSLPVIVSAGGLRDTLTAKVAALDPQGRDPALRQMVLIGHSQGGLLAKLSVVDAGDRLWSAISDKRPEELGIDAALVRRLRAIFFPAPLPMVTRVVYIAAPHRGSFRASRWVASLLRRLVALPYDLLSLDPSIYRNIFAQLKLPRAIRSRIPTSVDTLSPRDPVMRALAELPPAPGVAAHSIIAIRGKKAPPEGDDGVVTYASAHQEGVESEYIVRDGHSCQGNPLVIEEVRRILLEHLAKLPPP